MDPLDLVRRLSAIEHRAAGSDAERRAARLLASELRALGRRGTRVQTLWVRPAWAVVHALIAAVAVVGSVLAVDHPWVGLGLTAGALLAFAGDLSGRAPLLRRMTFERATQNVVSRDAREEARVRLIVTAAVDAPRAGLADRGAGARAIARARRALGGHLPGPHGLVALALAALVACTAARAAGVDATWLGGVQLAPTVILLLALGLFLDTAGAEAPRAGANANGAAAAVAIAIAAALGRRPPRNLAVDVVLAGAGEAHALGLRRYLTRLRREGVRGEQVAILHLAPCGSGRPVWWTRDGLVLPLRFHPQLVRLAAQTAREEAHLRAGPHESRAASGARAARALRWPAIAIGCVDADGVAPRLGARDDTPEHVDPAALDAALELALGVVARLDAELGAADAPAPPAREPRAARRLWVAAGR